MKCLRCGYISFDTNDRCPKCRKELTAERALLGDLPSPLLTSPSAGVLSAKTPASFTATERFDPHEQERDGILSPPEGLTIEYLEEPPAPADASPFKATSSKDTLFTHLKEEMMPLIPPSHERFEKGPPPNSDENWVEESSVPREEASFQDQPEGSIPGLKNLVSLVEEINKPSPSPPQRPDQASGEEPEPLRLSSLTRGGRRES